MERLKYFQQQKERIGYLADKVREGEELTEKELEEVAEAMDCPLDYIEDCYKGSDFEFIICQFADELQERCLFYCEGYNEGVRDREKSDNIFINHIRSHLNVGEKVICKICGKTATEIIDTKLSEEGKARHSSQA